MFMGRKFAKSEATLPAVLAEVVACLLALGQVSSAETTQTVLVRAAGFELGKEISVSDGTNRLRLALDQSNSEVPPFAQLAIKQGVEPALFGPDPKIPYFTVRFAMPIPPENATNNVAALTGIDPMVFTHNHSPGFEILPNGDALAVYFSTPPGKSESDPTTSFVQARLRYGAEEWDLPELFFKTENYNSTSRRRISRRSRSRARFAARMARFISRWTPTRRKVFCGAARMTAFTGTTWVDALADGIQ
jgi:hypothetical protein